MLNFLAKFLLSATSLMPLLLVIAVKTWEDTGDWRCGIPWVGVSLFLISLYWFIMSYVRDKAQRHAYRVGALQRKDQAIVSYLFVYLLPIVRSDDPTFLNHPITSGVVVAIILLAIARTDSFHFNPVMWLFRQRCYTVVNGATIPVLLITNVEKPASSVTIVRLAQNVYLHVGDDDDKPDPTSH